MKIDWLDDDVHINQLTLDNFPDFARDYAEYTYSLCFKATMDEKLTVSYCAEALANVLCKESRELHSEDIKGKEGIGRALLDILTKKQLSNMNKDGVRIEKSPSPAVIDEIVKKATEIATINMPRYARVFSGTTGSLSIIAIVALIVLAIVIVWVNPFSCSSSRSASVINLSGMVSSTARPDVDMLVDVAFDDAAAASVNTGVTPVLISLEGPDSRSVTGIAAYAPDGEPVEVYPCGEREYCFIAQSSDVYKIVISGDERETTSYKNIVSISGELDDNAPVEKFFVISHNETATIKLSSTAGISAQPKNGTLTSKAGGYEYIPGDGTQSIGLDTFSYTLSDGRTYTVPVLVTNSAPFIDISSLTSRTLHTPNRAGMVAANIKVVDDDGDPVVFTLKSRVGCSVLIAPNGGYVAMINPDFRAQEASFTFTVSDGISVSDPYTVKIALENNLIAASEHHLEFVCYSGEDGFYEFELPKKDDDGDSLEWSLVSDNTNGITSAWGSEVVVLEDGYTVRYRLNPGQTETFMEALTFTCTDGWLSGGLATIICDNKANQPPVSSGRNSSFISEDDKSVVISVSVNNDCEFDKCEIVSIDTVFGGEVVENEGWEDMCFTFEPNGEEQFCYVYLTVADTLTGQSVSITYYLTVR